jgi:UDP-2,3-diacylglucosamine hydrolase
LIPVYSTTKIYFASDFHLGTPSNEASSKRERLIIKWLDTIKQDASELYLVGDVFDFWFEYRTVVPKGYIRFLGKLAELSDMGIKITFFKGNHDMWMFDYLKKELNARVISDELIIELNGKRLFIHHGDGLGPNDNSYKILKKIFRSRICQWLFSWLHPDIGIGIANLWSKSSRAAGEGKEQFLGDDKEWLAIFAREYVLKNDIDYFIFGHRHLPLDIVINPKCTYINLGEWIHYQTYAVFDGEKLSLKKFEE